MDNWEGALRDRHRWKHPSLTDLRHSYAAFMLASGADIIDAQHALAPTLIAAAYLHLTKNRRRTPPIQMPPLNTSSIVGRLHVFLAIPPAWSAFSPWVAGAKELGSATAGARRRYGARPANG